MKAVIAPGTGGSVVVRVNEAEVLSLTGINTAATGVAFWDRAELLGTGFINGVYDDWYVLDGSGSAPWTDFFGDIRVDALFPTAEGASSAWTPLSGTDNALMVNDTAPNDDTSYVSTVTPGAIDTHVVQDAPVAGSVIYGCQMCISTKKADAGSATIAPIVRSAGPGGVPAVADYQGTTKFPGLTYAFLMQMYQTNPATGALWTEAELNAAEFGYKRVS
jgi:hypothetical protein